MKNKILVEQNKDSNLLLLSAQRQLYTDAKQFQLYELIFTVPVVIVIGMTVGIFPNLKDLGVILSIIILLLDTFYLKTKVKSLTKIAAKIQEQLDCNLFELRWNTTLVGKKPDKDQIEIASNKYLKNNVSFSDLEDWYSSEIKNLPITLARLACQKINCWWDSDLRKKYTIFLSLSLFFISIIIIFGSLYKDMTVKNLLYLLIPLLPIYNFLINQLIENIKTARREFELKQQVDSISKSDNEEKLNTKSRDLQNEIFNNRKNSNLIPDQFYFFFKSKHEKQTKLVVKAFKK